MIVENGGSGSSVAAPVARKVLDYYLLGEDANAVPEETEDTNAALEMNKSLESSANRQATAAEQSVSRAVTS